MSNKTIGIALLILGIAVLIWPSWTYVIFGVCLIVSAVLLLTGKVRIVK